ncbi:MAG: response regulator [Bacteroidia bacterium]|nr:response regulator [Bacteroidia bacterium]
MSSNKVIVIIDDEFIILESLSIQINLILPANIMLEAASSGEESIQLINELHKNGNELILVISDFNLDDMKGTEVLKHSISLFPKLRKIILTGQADSAIIADFKNEYGLDAIINKPWNFEEIKEIILESVLP